MVQTILWTVFAILFAIVPVAEARVLQIPKWEAKTTVTTTTKQKHFIDVCRQVSYNTRTKTYALTIEQCQIMEKAGVDYWIHPKYILAIWLSENILWWGNRWDGWCSKGWYQMNSCARTKRNSQWHITNADYVKQFSDCSLNFECSTRRTAERIKNYYCEHNTINNLQIVGAVCGARHQWYYPASWYKSKYMKNLQRVESLFYK